MIKNPPAMRESWVKSRVGRSPGEGNGYSLHSSGLENSMDKGGWWATVNGFAKSHIGLRGFHSLSSINKQCCDSFR